MTLKEELGVGKAQIVLWKGGEGSRMGDPAVLRSVIDKRT